MSNIVYRGTLTKDKLVELYESEFPKIKIEPKAEYDPERNQNAISLIRQEDGNWKGFAQKNGKFLEVREQAPEYCLQRLLTHE